MALTDEVKALQAKLQEETAWVLHDAERLERFGQQLSRSHRCWPSRWWAGSCGLLLLLLVWIVADGWTQQDQALAVLEAKAEGLFRQRLQATFQASQDQFLRGQETLDLLDTKMEQLRQEALVLERYRCP